MKNRICCIFNSAPHYRAPIYKKMDEELRCDFYFGDWLADSIKQMDYRELNGFKKMLPIKQLPHTGFEWQFGAWRLIFKPYKHYIITGTPGSLSNWALAVLARFTGKKVYAWTHGMKGNTTGFGKFVEKNFYRLCHKVLLYGEFSKNNMLKEGFKKEKLVIIYNSLDYEKQITIRKELKLSSLYKTHFGDTSPVIIYVGRLQKSKKIGLLIEAIAKLQELDTPCNLVLVGPITDDNDIVELPGQLGVEKRVWFYGPCYDEEKIGTLFYNSTICVSPGPVGLTALHAMTYGCPVITNDDIKSQMPEHEAIDYKKTGDFFKNNDLDDLVRTIQKWIDKGENERDNIRMECYKVIDGKYNPNHQITILKTILYR